MKILSWFKTRWKTGVGITMILAALVLLVLSTGVIEKPVTPEEATLADFVLVADSKLMEQAKAIRLAIEDETGITLPIVDADDYAKGHAIIIGAREYNSYGGFKYRITTEIDGKYANVYIDGEDLSLVGGGKELAKLSAKNKTSLFPFGIEEQKVGYEWNTEDATLTGLGYELYGSNETELADGVTFMQLRYKSMAMEKQSAFVIVMKAGADARFVASAAEWDETNSVENPVKVMTTGEHGQKLEDAGYEVLGICNAGYFQKAAGSNLPWGMQIIDGVVKQEPNRIEPKFSDNWVGVTKDGEIVMSNTEGYHSTYKDNIEFAVGGQYFLMENGVPNCISGPPMYRTAVGINDAGDFVIVTMDGSNYVSTAQIFMDLDMDIHTILNLDGGGSTTLYVRNDNGVLKPKIVAESPTERPVMDTIAIVKGKK